MLFLALGIGKSGGRRKKGTPNFISGLWIGKAIPHKDFVNDYTVATNPITWSLTLKQGDMLSIFGAGYFISDDVPGVPALMYTLRGIWNAKTGKVNFVKKYEHYE